MQPGVQFSNPMDLEKIYQMNPYISGQAQDQLNNQNALAQQFADQGLQQGAQNVRETELANLFNEQNNPLTLEKNRLANRGSTVDVNRKEATATQAIDQDLRDYALKAKESDLKQLETEGQRLAYSNDPQERAMGQHLLENHRDFIKARMEEELRGANRLKEIGATTAGQKEVEQMRIDAGKYVKTKAVGDFKDQISLALSKAKKASDQHAILTRASVMAEQAGEMALATNYQAQAAALEPQARAELAAAGNLNTTIGQNGLEFGARGAAVPSITNPNPPGGGAPTPAAPPIKLAPDPEAWINAAMQHNKISREQAIAEGRRLGRLK